MLTTKLIHTVSNIGISEWTIENMKKAVKNYETARGYYQKFLAVYESPQGGEDPRVKEAQERLTQIDTLITSTYSQVQALEDAKVELAAALEAEKAAAKEQEEQEKENGADGEEGADGEGGGESESVGKVD